MNSLNFTALVPYSLWFMKQFEVIELNTTGRHLCLTLLAISSHNS